MLKKHDIILYNFCQIRREVMNIIRDNFDEIDRETYEVLRKLLDTLNIAIHNYNQFKSSIFNLGNLLKSAKETQRYVLRIENVKLPEDESIHSLYRKLNIAMLKAFLSYTPLFRSIFLPLAIRGLRLFLKTGINFVVRKWTPILDLLLFYDKKVDEYNIRHAKFA